MAMDHLGIAVRSLAEALPRWERALGVRAQPLEELPSQKVRVAFLAVGATDLELLEATSPESAIGRFVVRRGEGIHHVAFRVPDVDAKLAELGREGIEVIDAVGRPGARGRRVGFAHPSGFGGVLVEFVEGA